MNAKHEDLRASGPFRHADLRAKGEKPPPDSVNYTQPQQLALTHKAACIRLDRCMHESAKERLIPPCLSHDTASLMAVNHCSHMQEHGRLAYNRGQTSRTLDPCSKP